MSHRSVAEGREQLGEEMHKNECDWCGRQRHSKENVEELCQEGHEGYGYKGRNGAELLLGGILLIIKY